ncbi:hypothetical protein [Streptomyces fulvoviolaceus]|uniref:hypothetical protein n=1 Tax=Streptomyces fulvoviolaceus TaxID=285535 RepID=UPI0018FE5DF4|nr:hypothetical protein [Streptomyces fulvoviolaceus]MCT9079296.1 hypothetical protein [Streptomyces fulvoviolaceus]
MSADRETSHDMTNSDISLLLADAADEVEIGIAPYQAVIRGGRRRRARRWAVAAATALVLAGSSATLAVAGLPGGDGGRVAPAATQPSQTPKADVSAPQRTTLATGTDQGTKWQVTLDVWSPPGNEAEAEAQMSAMALYGENPPDADKASDLIGKITYFVHRTYGEKSSPVMENTVPKSDTLSGTDLMSGALPLKPGGDKAERLLIGYVAKTAQRVTCTWKDGTATQVEREPSNTTVSTDEPAIRSADGSPYDWFVCVAPKGTAYKSAEVTLPGA